jgi:hypothetical protein
MKIFFMVLLISSISLSQQNLIKGTVLNKETNEPLAFATVRISGIASGTTTNREGKYELRCKAGKLKLIASFMGFVSDTLTLIVSSDISNIDFKLKPSTINLSEVIILPKENPANEIIRRAIIRKDQRNRKIQSYKFNAYTKGVVKTNADISGRGGGTFSLGIGINDSASASIAGILENQSVGYFKQPNNYKEEILARKQTSNFPPSVNTLTGGRIIQNFYSDDINFFGRPLPGPVSKNALEYYYFYIEDTVSIDNQNVFQLMMTPDDSLDPGFVGKVFISAASYDLMKVDFELNRTANTGGFFDTIKIFQNFYSFTDSIFMPTDYHLYLHSNVLGIAQFAFELNTALHDYEMNIPLTDDFFTKAILTVMTDADKKDSTYWEFSQRIPNTIDEVEAYKKIDSVESIPQTFWDNFSFLSNRINFTKNLSISAPLALYHFNRVEGHSLDFGIFLNEALDSRLNSQLKFSYGFADKKFKYDLTSKYYYGKYRTINFDFEVFNKTKILFEEAVEYSEFFTTLLALLSKNDIGDYYYSKGVKVGFESELTSVLKLKSRFFHATENSAVKNTEYSFFGRNKIYRQNPFINDLTLSYFNIGFGLDFRDYIEDGMYRRRVANGASYILLDGSVTLSTNGLIKSDLDFTLYELRLRGKLNTYGLNGLNFRIHGLYNDGALPYQMLYSLPGNINLSSRSYTFRTLKLNEVLGDKIVTAFFEHNFGDQLFRWMQIPYLKSSELQLNTFFNIAYADLGNKSKKILANDIKILKHPLYEVGFGISNILFPIQLEFSWRLNYRGQNDFVIGLSSFIID